MARLRITKVVLALAVGAALVLSGVPAAQAAAGWSSAASMGTARAWQTATLLTDGRVLVAGGAGSGGTRIASAELYDPVTNSWSSAGSMADARYDDTATRLANGKVLVAGGYGGSGLVLRSAELYDPATNRWSSAGMMATARASSAAALLPSGKVLVAGGYSPTGRLSTPFQPVASAELYDPATNSWSSAGTMLGARAELTATLLPTGKVLVVSCGCDDPVASAQLYDPATNSWAAAAPMATPRTTHTATLLPNGSVLVAGGSGTPGILAGAEAYNPVTNSWSAAGTMAGARARATAALLWDGEVLVAGGQDPSGVLATAEIYHPAVNRWSSAGVMPEGREGQTMTALGNGKVLVAGGYSSSGQYLASAELYTPASLPPVPAPVLAKRATVTPVSGTVRIRLPGTKRFIDLRNAASIPFGSTIDATKGRVRIIAAKRGGGTQSAEFYQGQFRLTQERRTDIVEATLNGPLTGCAVRRHVVAAARKPPRKPSRRRLFANTSGRFRTRGNYGSASVRGTIWLTEDRCDATFFKAIRGAITVRDFPRRKTVTVRAPHSYLARAIRK